MVDDLLSPGVSPSLHASAVESDSGGIWYHQAMDKTGDTEERGGGRREAPPTRNNAAAGAVVDCDRNPDSINHLVRLRGVWCCARRWVSLYLARKLSLSLSPHPHLLSTPHHSLLPSASPCLRAAEGAAC